MCMWPCDALVHRHCCRIYSGFETPRKNRLIGWDHFTYWPNHEVNWAHCGTRICMHTQTVHLRHVCKFEHGLLTTSHTEQPDRLLHCTYYCATFGPVGLAESHLQSPNQRETFCCSVFTLGRSQEIFKLRFQQKFICCIAYVVIIACG